MPVVSQSSRNEMVPVGAMTVACELRTPTRRARARTLVPASGGREQIVRARARRSTVGDVTRCMSSTAACPRSVLVEPGERAHAAAIRADVA